MAGPKDIEAKYKKHELRTHILEIPDTYIGSIERTQLETYAYDDETKKFSETTLSYVPGLYKIFDEVLVNSVDQVTRLVSEVKAGKADVRPVKNIRVNIDQTSGWITVTNDGDGIDVEKHSEYNDIWVPELIFGELLTSSNYDQTEERLWGGKNGYGAKLANIFSKEFIVETVDHRRKRSYSQRFHENMKSRDKPVVKASSKAPSTTIKFLPDFHRFGIRGLDADMMKLLQKRVYDACATTPNTVSVFFNDVKLDAKDFEKFSELYIGQKEERPRAFEVCNDRWEVLATVSEQGAFRQVSFVNGINTLKGGKHVEYITNQITKRIVEMAAKKKKDVKAQHIKDNLWLFVKCYIANPAFDSQTKETLTTQAGKFGSKCELSDKFFEKLYKTGIVEKAVSLTEFHDQKKLAKTDGKKTTRVLIPKLDDANQAGTKNSRYCTLILTEGDSAKTTAIAGLSVVGRDRYGVFPLRGKMLNVKDAPLKKIMENEEITNLKKILGLEQGKTYSDVGDLRYGKIMALTDQDHDGSHIKGLLFNVFQTLWPSLYRAPAFLTSMLTPIVKASSTAGAVIEFYNLTDFEDWKEARAADNGLRGWSIKYYKGLGTSTAEEAKKYFKDLKLLEYKYTGPKSDEGIDLAFNKKRTDDRKDWLTKRFDRSRVLKYTEPIIPYEMFVNDELIHFSNRDLERSIPSVCDGFKESNRKIMFGCFKKKLYTKEIRVAQLSGYISEVAVYHHGEKSLQDAIVNMAQNFVGANNINYLVPSGQFGTRIQGGKDAASARYIHTLLSPLARKIFKEQDAPTLNHIDDDGTIVEPEFYVPIIPTVLINGGLGIGTGFSTNIPSHNPSDVINMCAKIIAAIDNVPALANIDQKTDLDAVHHIIDKVALQDIRPWYLGFTGSIEPYKEEGSFQSKGKWEWLDDQTLEITELPIGTWTEDYKEFLTEAIANGSAVLKDFENHYTDKKVKFILKFYPGVRPGVEMNLETEFKLVSTKPLNMSNMHLFNEKGIITRYKNAKEIVRTWAKVRITKYWERKKYMLRKMEADYKVLAAKVRFIQDVISGQVIVMNKKMKDVEDQLVALKYPKFYIPEAFKAMDADAEASTDALDAENTEASKGPVDYGYLTRMPIHHLTFEKKQALEKEAGHLDGEIKTLRTTPIQRIWQKELTELSTAWEDYKVIMEKDIHASSHKAEESKARPAARKAPAAKKK